MVMNYDLIDSGRSQFLLVASGALFILLFIIVAYYIYQFNNNPSNVIASNVYPMASPTPTIPASADAGAAGTGGVSGSQASSTAAPIGYHLASTPFAKEVFAISENIYSYQDAPAVCKAFNSELATYEQIVDAASKGSHWCSYGWSADQRILYPVQKSIWQKMLGNYGGGKGACGRTWPAEFAGADFAVQGGFEPNPNMTFGVSCYGVKSSPLAHESVKVNTMSDAEIELQNKAAQIAAKRDQITVLPFNASIWSNIVGS